MIFTKKKYSLLSIMIAVCMVLGSIPVTVHAEGINMTASDNAVCASCGGTYENGFCADCSGYEPAVLTEDKYDLDEDGNFDVVYEISNAGQLYWFSKRINTVISGKEEDITHADENAVLVEDIIVNCNVLTKDADGKDVLSAEADDFISWNVIGYSSVVAYAGIFDGNDHVISGLYHDSGSMVGLFGYVAGTVTNVKVVDSYFAGSQYIAGIAGYSDGGKIINCSSSAYVEGNYDYTGGIVGQSIGSGKIANCSNYGSVTGIQNTGGIVGSQGESVSIENCTNSGTITLTDKQNVGGIVGQSIGYGKIAGCVNNGSVTGANYYVGGIVGYTTSTGGISNCINNGSVGNTSYYTGGIAGFNYNTITDCTNNGTISGGTSSTGGITGYATKEILNSENSGIVGGTGRVGGIAGYSSKSVSNCINSGSVNATESSAAGIVAYNEAAIEACVNMASVTGTTNVGGIAGYHKKTIEKCSNSGVINGKYLVGGIAGDNRGNVTDCYNENSVACTTNTAGGLVGSNNGSLTDCYNRGSVSGVANRVGGIAGSAAVAVTNCYYLTGCAVDGNNVSQFGVGSTTTGSTTADVAAQTEEKTVEQFVGGEVAFLLNGSVSGGDIWYQNIDNDREKDAYPVLNSEHGAVYAGNTCTLKYTNSADKISQPQTNYAGHCDIDISNGICNACGEQVFESGSVITLNDDGSLYTYNGSAHIPQVIVTLGDYTLTKDTDYTVEYRNNINAGTATVVISGSGAFAGSVSKEFTIHKATLSDLKDITASFVYATSAISTESILAEIPEDAGKLIYSYGDVKTPDNSNVQITQWDVNEEGILSASLSNGGVGDSIVFPVTVTSTNYEDVTINVVVTLIGKTQVNINGIVSAGDVIYDGTQKAGYIGVPTNSEGYNGSYEIIYSGTLSNGSAYGPVSVAPTQAGQYTVFIKVPEDNEYYTGEVSAEFAITKAKLSVAQITAADKVYDGDNRVAITEVKLNGYLGDDSKGIYVVTSDLYGTVSGSDAGEYTEITLNSAISISGGDAVANYELVQPVGALTSTVIIHKAPLQELETVTEYFMYTVSSLTVEGLGAEIPEDAGRLNYKCGDAKVSKNSMQISSWSVDEEGKLTAYLSGGVQGESITFPVTISSTNYADAAVNVVVNLTGKHSVTITDIVSTGDAVYDGTQNTGFSGTPGNDDGYEGNYEILYFGMLADGTVYGPVSEAPTQTGDYTVTIKVPDSEKSFEGQLTYAFSIIPAALTLTVKDLLLISPEELPATYEYIIEGIQGEDIVNVTDFSWELVPEPEWNISSGKYQFGKYIITLSDATIDNSNYIVTKYVPGKLIIAEPVSYTVTFDVQGIGTAPESIDYVIAGSLINKPEIPIAEGYTFEGWYLDKACTKAWDFSANIVQDDITLYACWTKEILELNYGVQEIADLYYTGSALKPAIKVYDTTTGTILKAGTDYTVKYYNNTKVNSSDTKNGIGYKTDGKVADADIANLIQDASFSFNLPYAVISGMGNYSGLLYVNFNILPVSISDEAGEPAKGFTLKYNDQLTSSNKSVLKPFTSLKYKKSMKAGTDYTVELKALNACDNTGAALTEGTAVNGGTAAIPSIPKGYSGSFLMTVTGMGNYTGAIAKTIYVQPKSTMLKNATITLGANLKKQSYNDGKAITLTPAVAVKEGKKTVYYAVENGAVTETVLNAKDVFTVKAGSAYLVYGKDYTVNYTNNKAVGTATMTITGMGDYLGSKSVTFKIAGVGLKAKDVAVIGLGDKFYTGKAITQNGVQLVYKKPVSKGVIEDVNLIYGKDYIIRYKNNIKAGTATMTFRMLPASGYTGTFSKTFKIKAVNLDAAQVIFDVEGTDVSGNITANYTKVGAKPVVAITDNGTLLTEGKDYTVKYTNNTAVTTDKTTKKPLITIKGKGNYTGTVTKTFTINASDINAAYEAGELTVTVASIAFNPKKADSYAYKPKVIVKAGNKTLKAGKDYAIAGYSNNTQEAVAAYLKKLAAGESTEGLAPYVTIGTGTNGTYIGDGFTVDMHIYGTKLSSGTTYVIVDTAVYTGSQVTPKVTVFYGSKAQISAVKAAVKKGTEVQTAVSANDLIELTEGSDYSLSYGKNVTAGTNKGTVTITGDGFYGGSVTAKFTINKLSIYN